MTLKESNKNLEANATEPGARPPVPENNQRQSLLRQPLSAEAADKSQKSKAQKLIDVDRNMRLLD